MPTEVPGQFFGYSLQWPRAYLNLLKIPSDAAVSVEEFSDVGILYSDGSKTAEEDKSSISGKNPVSDASTSLRDNLLLEQRIAFGNLPKKSVTFNIKVRLKNVISS